MSRYISIAILIFAFCCILGIVILQIGQGAPTTSEVIILMNILNVAILSVIITLLIRINEIIKKIERRNKNQNL